MQQTSQALHTWFKGVQPLYPELFNAAHVMCGNYELAEYALRSALLDVWLQNASTGMGFRERLRSSLRREAFEAAQSDEGIGSEFTWPGISAEGGAGPLLAQLAREDIEAQRLVLLHHGCGLSMRAAGQLTGLSQSQVRAELKRVESRCRRSLPARDRSRTEALIARQAKRLLARRGPDIPHPAQVYRTFAAEAAATQTSGHRASRIVGIALTALMALFCAAAFWLFAVLVRPGGG